MTPRLAAQGLAFGRIAIGATLLVAPERIMRLWLGRAGKRTATHVLARALGARDLVLGVGSAVSLTDGAFPRRWVQAALVADAADFAATYAAGDALPRRGRVAVMAMAGGATLAGLALSLALD